MDIGIYTTEKTLKHKIKMSRNKSYEFWWTLNKEPKILPKRLYVAVNGRWCGYFKVIGQYYRHPNRLYLGRYTEIICRMPRKPFQGFTYNVPKHTIQKRSNK